MDQKNTLWGKLPLFNFLLFVLLFFQQEIKAQCAGNDTTITVCNYADPTNQSIDLFNALTGNPTPGGTWFDPLQTGALDLTTGILNVWNIHISGIYTFTYTAPNVPGCTDNTAIITLNLGGYSGITSPNGSACSDDESVNLFQFFTGEAPNPHLNGFWHDDDNTGALNDNIFNAFAAGIGVYHFTYTMPAIGGCPAMSSTAVVTVYRLPFPGIPARALICNTVDFSLLTDVNLYDFLAGEDENGMWTENGTSEFSDPFEGHIDIQNIYNTFGLGTYSFTYTVYPTNPVCQIRHATVQIIIEEPLDFTGAVLTVNSDICENDMVGATYSATLTQGNIVNPIGAYKIFYTVTGTVPFEHSVTTSFDVGGPTGIITFALPASYFPAVGSYTVAITRIIYLGNEGACENIIDASDVLTISPIPKINLATLAIAPICGDTDVVVVLSGVHNLENGTNYEITYNLTGSNTATAQTVVISVTGGIATFTIPAALVPNVGTTLFRITNIVNLTTGCANTSTLAKNFVKNALPNVTTLTATIADKCEGDAVLVQISGLGTLSNVNIFYNLSGANSAGNQSATLSVAGGTGTFTIPAALLPNLGTTTLTIFSLINNTTACSSNVTNVSGTFTINALPSLPIANNQAFCNTINATVADLIPNGNSFNWYDSATSITPLNPTDFLVSGNYYVSEINGSLCESGRTAVVVTINIIPEPTLNEGGQNFCGANNPTLLDLTANLNASGIVWYDAAENGNILDNAQLLEQGFTYYAYGFSDQTNCLSQTNLAVTVSLTQCDQEQYALFIPDGFSPNNDAVNDAFHIPDIEFLFPDYVLEIYNRFGNLLYTGTRYVPDWDGRNSQSSNTIEGIAANGVYFYVLYFNKSNFSPRQGQLYLNR
jgi:gliding motility-associated-like protein